MTRPKIIIITAINRFTRPVARCGQTVMMSVSEDKLSHDTKTPYESMTMKGLASATLGREQAVGLGDLHSPHPSPGALGGGRGLFIHPANICEAPTLFHMNQCL